MKKNVLALSIAAMIGGLGFAGAASAGVIVGTGAAAVAPATAVADAMQKPTIDSFKVAEGGVGHALIVPYYTVQNDNMTVLHLVNTDNKSGKVVKVRFRGAANSDDVMDFQVLLSPGDVWTAAVTKGADGFANLVTNDGTCTIPALTKGTAVSFRDGRLNPALTGDALANQTREGYVEIFNSADIPSDSIYFLTGASVASQSALYTAIKHVGGNAPCTGAAINKALFTTNFDGAVLTDEKAAANLGLDAPTGGLMGDWYIINVPNTTTFAGAATALVGVDAGGKQAKTGNFVAFPQNDAMVIATPENYTTDPTLVSAGLASLDKNKAGVGATATTVASIEAIALDFPDLSTPYVGAASAAAARAQAERLTQALAVSSITNQYAKDASISAKTDWVFSMPTRRYSVAVDYAYKNPITNAVGPARVYSVVTGKVGGAVPTTTANLQYFSKDNTELVDGKVCVGTQSVVFRDREEQSKSSAPVFSPSKANSTRLCGETSVLSFGEGLTAASVLGAAVAREDVAAAALFENGWGIVNTANYAKGTLAAAQAGDSIGLPILGYSVVKLTNPAVAAGTSGNFGITWPHRFAKVNP